MHPADIKAGLQKKGSGVSRAAVRLKVNRSSVSRVISGKDTSRRIAKHISSVIGIPVSQIWPGKYSEPSQRQSRRNRIVARRGAQVSGKA